MAEFNSSCAESSDEDYFPLEGSDSDCDSDSDYTLVDTDVDDFENSGSDERTAGSWNLIGDVFRDERPNPLPDFTSVFSGVNPALEVPSTPSDAFKLFFDEDVVSKLCQWTNERAEKFFASRPQTDRKVNSLRWRPVTVDDMYTFFGLLLSMGITKLPRLFMYWSKGPMFSGPAIFCAEVMSWGRFMSILKFLRFSPVQHVRKGEPKTRIEPFLDLLRAKCQLVMRSDKHITVDEALILYKGRLRFRQFMKSKRARFGVKVFVLCPSEPGWNGYSWNFHLYYGKDNIPMADPGALCLSSSEKVVVYLMEHLLDEGRHVVTDNWYTSLRLSDYLQTRKTLLTGVVRDGRGPPKVIQNEKLQRHQCVFARQENTLVVKWKDKREVTVLTTKYEAGVVEKNKTYFGGDTVFFNKPLPVEKYTEKMGSVDLADQMLEPYDTHRKCKAWFKKLGIHFVFRCLLNSFICLRNVAHYSEDFMNFIIAASRELLQEHNLGAASLLTMEEMQNNPPSFSVPSDVHQFVKSEDGKRRRCRVCYPARKDTAWHCPGCPGSPALCSMAHYRQWHNQVMQPGPSHH